MSCSHRGPIFRTFTVSSWTTGQLGKLSAKVTEIWTICALYTVVYKKRVMVDFYTCCTNGNRNKYSLGELQNLQLYHNCVSMWLIMAQQCGSSLATNAVSASRLDNTGRLFLLLGQQIYSCFHWYNKCKNPPWNMGVMVKIKVARFLWTTVYIHFACTLSYISSCFSQCFIEYSLNVSTVSRVASKLILHHYQTPQM